MKTIFVDNSGKIYLPSSVSIPRDAVEVEVESVPDIDLYLYVNNVFVKKSSADAIEAERSGVTSTQEILLSRQMAYKAESDPLYMEWQYDNTPESEQAWRTKVAEIKARYPLPSES
ncbi:hypothetical protein WOC35_19410 [Vibrio parahaemolyticus]|uniref:hypothetical protein n=1 Tax=Vibrio parahaemolyticus TaxID=670 RepID=UPI002F2D2C1F